MTDNKTTIRDETDIASVAHGTTDTKSPTNASIHLETLPTNNDKPSPPLTVTPSDNTRLLRTIDLHILPIILIIYCLQSLDKTALSYASVFGLENDLNLQGQEYSWCGAIVYVAQLVWQPIIAYMLVKFPLGKFIATMVLCWGATLCGMTASQNFGGLMASRFVLGSFEASVAPTFIALVQMWYRRGEQTNRNAAWYSMLGIVNIVGALLCSVSLASSM